MKNLVKYLLAISLLSNAHMFGAVTAVEGGKSASTPAKLTEQLKTAKNAAFDDLFEGNGTLKQDFQITTTDKLSDANSFVTELAAKAKKIAHLIDINNQDGTLTDDASKQFTITGGKQLNRSEAFKELQGLYKKEFDEFKEAYKSSSIKDKPQDVIDNYLNNIQGDGLEKKLLEKYKKTKEKETDPSKEELTNIALFIELITLHVIAPDQVKQETVTELIKSNLLSARNKAVKDDFIQSFFAEDSLSEFWDQQVEEFFKLTDSINREAAKLKHDIDSQTKDKIEESKLSSEIQETAKHISKAVMIIANHEVLNENNKKNFNATVKNLQAYVKKITTALGAYLVKGKDDEQKKQLSLTFIKEKFVKQSKKQPKDTLEDNLTEYFSDAKPEAAKPEASKSIIKQNTIASLAELYFIAGTVPGVTLTTIKLQAGSKLELAEQQYGSTMRAKFFPQHASVLDRAKNICKEHPYAVGGASVAAAVALAAVATAGTAYAKGRSSGLGFWKTIKKWAGRLNAQDKAEIAATSSIEQIEKAFDKDKKTATEILTLKTILQNNSK